MGKKKKKKKKASGRKGVADESQEVIDIDAPATRVLAGPGAGKSFALMRRVSRLLEDGAVPERILVCTFTRVAARDLRTDLEALGASGAGRIRVDTVHGHCLRLLGQQGVLESIGRNARMLKRFEERFLLRDLGKQFGVLRDRQRRLKDYEVAGKAGRRRSSGDEATFRQHAEAWLRGHDAMLIGEPIWLARQYLRSRKSGTADVLFDHVIVDEYQDLNANEQQVVQLLVRPDGQLMIIGDEDQSIYGFRQAHPQGILRFGRPGAETEDLTLKTCRRCPKSVVRASQRLIAANASASGRVLEAYPANIEGEVLQVRWDDPDAEALGIADMVKARMRSDGLAAEDVLVLVPRRLIGRKILEGLQARRIPSQLLYADDVLDANPEKNTGTEAIESFTLLTLLARPDDQVAIRVWCGLGHRHLRAGEWRRLQAACGDGLDPAGLLEDLAAGRAKVRSVQGLLDRFGLLKRRRKKLRKLRGRSLIDALFPPKADWAERLNTVATQVAPRGAGAAKLLDALEPAIRNPEAPSHTDRVRVLSMHLSKGLSAKCVIVAGCVEGVLPVSGTSDEDLEEQRRLFYVAITRTKATLILSSVESIPRSFAGHLRMRNDRGGDDPVAVDRSRFIQEMEIGS